MAGIQILRLQHILVVSNFEAHITTARLCVCVYALKHLYTGKAVTLSTMDLQYPKLAMSQYILVSLSQIQHYMMDFCLLGTELMSCRYWSISWSTDTQSLCLQKFEAKLVFFLFLWFLFFISFFVDIFSDNSMGARYLPVEIKRKYGGKLARKNYSALGVFFLHNQRRHFKRAKRIVRYGFACFLVSLKIL